MGTAPLPRGGFSAHLLLEVITFPCQACTAVSEMPAGKSSNSHKPSFPSFSYSPGAPRCPRGAPKSTEDGSLEVLPVAGYKAVVSKFPSVDSSLEVNKS